MAINKKVCILGNSVPLLLIPSRRSADEKTYHEHLEDMGFCVINASKQAVMLADIYRYLEDEVIRHFPEYIVINMGIVEATFRTRGRWLHNFFSENAWNNDIIDISYCSVVGRGIRRTIKAVYRPFGRLLYFFGIKWRYMPPWKFRHSLKDIIRKLIAYCPVKKVIILGMLPIGDKLEKIVPGTKKSVDGYNSIMENVAKEFEKAVFVKMSDVFSDKDMLRASADSIHLTSYGHEKVSKYVALIINGAR